MLKVYLAGPDVFLQNAVDIGNHKKTLCRDYGFDGLFPADKDEDVTADPAEIFSANCSLMHQADIGIFNLTPFRGPSADAGTVYELGFMFAQDKPVFGYSSALVPYADRVGQLAGPLQEQAGRLWDQTGFSVEDFGLADNLMIARAIAESGGSFIAIDETDGDAAATLAALQAFEACLKAAQQKMDTEIGAVQAEA